MSDELLDGAAVAELDRVRRENERLRDENRRLAGEVELARMIGESAGPSFVVDADGSVSPRSVAGSRMLEVAAVRGNLAELHQTVLGRRAEFSQKLDEYPAEYLARRWNLARDGRPTGAEFVVLEDVTERKEAERQRDALRRVIENTRKLEALSTLAGGIAHEMNNMLQPIIGLTSSVMLGLDPGGRDHEALSIALDAANRAADLVAGILRFSRGADASALVDAGGVVDPAVEVRAGVALLRSTLARGLDLIVEIDAAAPRVTAPRGVIERLVVEIGLNAMWAMRGRTGAIRVGVERIAPGDPDFGATHGGGALVRVVDQGAGMSPEVLERCLDPFFTTKEAGEGAGLGLAVANASVAAARGRLVVGAGPDGGTVVAFALPAAEAEGAGDHDDRR